MQKDVLNKQGKKKWNLELEKLNLAEAKLLKVQPRILKIAFIISMNLKKHLYLRFKDGT